MEGEREWGDGWYRDGCVWLRAWVGAWVSIRVLCGCVFEVNFF